MNTADIGQFVVDNWQIVFIYGLKILNDTNKNIRNLDKIVAVHDAEMKILKNCPNFNRRSGDNKD